VRRRLSALESGAVESWVGVAAGKQRPNCRQLFLAAGALPRFGTPAARHRLPADVPGIPPAPRRTRGRRPSCPRAACAPCASSPPPSTQRWPSWWSRRRPAPAPRPPRPREPPSPRPSSCRRVPARRGSALAQKPCQPRTLDPRPGFLSLVGLGNFPVPRPLFDTRGSVRAAPLASSKRAPAAAAPSGRLPTCAVLSPVICPPCFMSYLPHCSVQPTSVSIVP
jgi:hypothetical protein